MKLLFENWRKYMEEDASSAEEFMLLCLRQCRTIDENELDQINNSIATIVNYVHSELDVSYSPPEPLENIQSGEPEQVTEAEEDELGATPYQLGQASPEHLKFRKQYYGPEGELTKRGPKAAKDLEHGLGHMSAEEFEESGHVLKVPQEVLKDFQQLVESTQETEGLYEEARDWYHNIRNLLDQETDSDRDSALLGLMIATYSPRAKFALNLTEAVFMYKAVKEDVADKPERLKEYLETFIGAEKREPGAPRGFTGAHKVPNFALNLVAPNLAGTRGETGEIDYDDLYEWNSTIDTWMIDAFYPSLRKASTAKEWETIKGKLMSNVVSYRYMAKLVAKEARNLKILPHELQALIWVASQIRQTGEAGLGVTTQFAYDQIRQAITNVANINNDLKSLELLEEKDWLGTILSKIDSEGFEEAAKVALEKGQGVRSITSRGKKGAMFDYFPAPEKVEKPKGPKKAKKDKEKEKVMKPYEDPQFEDLKTHYVMNNVIQMASGKFNNLYDSIMLYMDPEFSTEKVVEYITGRFDPEARATKSYFKESLIKIRIRSRK